MKSFTVLQNLFTNLSNNTSSANQTLGGILINDAHRYSLLKYFDNEKTVVIQTVGPQTLALTTATLAAGSTSATLTANWTYPTCHQLVVFSDGEQRSVIFTQNSATITWSVGTATIQTTASISCVGVQSYPLGAQVSKIKNSTITIGQLVYTPYPIQSIQEWTKLNALPYTSSVPAYFYVYDNELQFWPIPSATGNIVTIYCQINVADMTYADVTGTLASSGAAVGSNLVTASGAIGSFPTATDLTYANLFLSIAPPGGDGLYYQIQSFPTTATMVLLKPIVNVPTPTGATFTVGQYPLLHADFHDTLVYQPLTIYFSSIVKDSDKFQTFNAILQNKLELMKGYLSTKQVNVDLGEQVSQRNSNLFTFAR